MPTSPKTAKEVLEEFENRFIYLHDFTLGEGKGVVRGMDNRSEYEKTRAFLLSAMRAAVEAVRPEIEGIPEECECDFDDRVKRFFNDDPTSPPTPKPE